MSDIWNFSHSSQPILEQCLAVATKNDNNKWLREFGSFKDNFCQTYSKNSFVSKENEKHLREAPCITVSDDENESEPIQQPCSDNSNICDHDNFAKLCEIIENELSTGYNLMVDECAKNPHLLERLANHLSGTTLEKICKMFFEKNQENKQFVTHIFKYFFPAYIRKEYNCFTIELLLQSNKIYPNELKILICAIVNDLNIPNKLLQDYVTTLNEFEQAKFIRTFVDLDLASDKIVHNLFSIYTAYKGCTKIDGLQNAVLLLLYEHRDVCAMDKNYGRLLLTYLQTVKSSKEDFNLTYIETIIATHRSPFKRPCLTILNELTGIRSLDVDSDCDKQL